MQVAFFSRLIFTLVVSLFAFFFAVFHALYLPPPKRDREIAGFSIAIHGWLTNKYGFGLKLARPSVDFKLPLS